MMRYSQFLLFPLVLTTVVQFAAADGNCQAACAAQCDICPQAKTCTAEEINCGKGLANGVCEPDEVCVAKNCECKTFDFS